MMSEGTISEEMDAGEEEEEEEADLKLELGVSAR